ncbi:MAG: efflux RND transporter periplasmic adaptor subunit [Snowella sp.]|nr:efflux RND transporter periplasmic adaptor subunit [Snowella sp.]
MINSSFSRQAFSLVIGFSLLITACGEGEKQKAAGPRALPVKLQQLEPKTVVDSSEFVGTLIAHEFVQLAPKINGRILKIFANYGQAVKRNDPILLLEPTQQQEDVNAAIGNVNVQKATLDRSQADVRTAEAQRDAAQSDIATQQANIANAIANFANAQEVTKTREADLKRAQASLNLAEINYKRSKFLVETGVQPQQDLDNKTTELKNAQADVDAALKTVQAAKASAQAAQASVGAAKSALKQIQDNVRAASQRVAAAQADIKRQQGAIQQAQGQLGSTTQNLIFNRVVAPIDGIVGTITLKVGDVLQQGESFTTITNNALMEMNINVPVERVPQLRKGLTAEIINQDGSSGVVGQIGFVSPTVDQNSQSVLAKVMFPNNGTLRNNQYVRVRLIWNRQPGLLIPTSAITNVGAQKFVFVAQSDTNKADKSQLVVKQTPVTVGNIQGQSYQVLSGINAGERVVVSRILELRDGTLITDESTMTKQVVEQ